jgi:lipopolysaccharide export system permease protein
MSTTEERIAVFRAKYARKKELKNNILTKYLIHELLLYFLVAFLFFFMVFFVNQVLLFAENILKQRVPLWDVIKLITYSLPFIIAQSAPFATLVGFLMCLGRLVSDNEILIIRASGFSYRIIMVPVLLLGLIISMGSFFVNDYLLPVGTIHYNKLYRSILASKPEVELEPHSIKRLNDSVIIVGDVSDDVVSDLVFFDRGKDNKMRIIVAGKSFILSAKREGVIMQMNMSGATAAFFDPNNRNDFDVLDSKKVMMNIFDTSFFDAKTTVNPREMTSFDLGRVLHTMRKDKNENKRTVNVYVLEYNKKFSLPFGSLFFALLALPLAFLFGKHNGQTIGMLVGIFICVLYWAMMILGQIFASRNGFSGFWSMWLPNIVVGGTGVLLYTILKRR